MTRSGLLRRQRIELLRSLEAPHPDTAAITSLGLAAWADGLPVGDNELLDSGAGVPLRWIAAQGWEEGELGA